MNLNKIKKWLLTSTILLILLIIYRYTIGASASLFYIIPAGFIVFSFIVSFMIFLACWSHKLNAD